jgi:hypothetical protein
MYKNILFGFFILCFISCKTQDVPQLKEGTFQREKPYTFLGNKRIAVDKLLLYPDSTFLLSLDGAVIIIQCQGRWSYIDKNVIELKCREPYFLEEYSGGYMNVRKRNVKIMNENKIKLQLPEPGGKKYIILKRIITD